ncbi:MAG: UbiD family decarboxylase [Planctomycetes bacterium]|nr:UbiD family decarboxylase [Planctomycetota bacterium]
MPHEFLSDFLSKLQDAGELIRIAPTVETALEVAAITDRACRQTDGGPALLFENPKGSSIPILTNLLGSRRRLCLALGIDSLDQLIEKMERMLRPESGGWLEALKLAPSMAGLSKFTPRVIKTAVCQQVVKLGRDVNLWDLPIPRCWPEEANPAITAGQVLTQDAATGERSVARFPVQVFSQQQLIPHWHRQHASHHQWLKAVREQRQLPIAVALGGDPLNILMTGAAQALTVPADTLLFGGFLRGTAIDLVRARSIELEVPAASEIVVEGYLDYAAPMVEAPPIASASGHYVPAEPLPVIQVTAITHRANPMLPAIVPGMPPTEESWIALAMERLSLAMVKATIPDIVDIHLPFAGASRNLLFVSLQKTYPSHARQVLSALWGSRLLGLNKVIVLVDADVDVQSEDDVWFAVGANVNPGRDLIVADGPTHMDDHTNEFRGTGQKLGIDATRKHPEEVHSRNWPNALTMPAELIAQLRLRAAELGIDHWQ